MPTASPHETVRHQLGDLERPSPDSAPVDRWVSLELASLLEVLLTCGDAAVDDDPLTGDVVVRFERMRRS